MSLAHNLLRQIPKNVLLLTSSLQYLSLADNNFYTLFEEEETTFGEMYFTFVPEWTRPISDTALNKTFYFEYPQKILPRFH